jgi:hypothetical protein
MEQHELTVTQRATRNTIQLFVWTLAWVGSLALASFGPKFLWAHQPVVSWIAIALNVALGVGWIVAHARYLRRSEELQRKILLDATAIALGVGLVGGFAYAAAENVKLIAFESDIAFLSVLMAVVYIVATLAGNLRYR